jgi:hypothetical protein
MDELFTDGGVSLSRAQPYINGYQQKEGLHGTAR